MEHIERLARTLGSPRLGAFAVLSLVIATGCAVAAENEGTAEPESAALATVGETTITQEEVEQTVASDLQRLERERHEILERGLENLINDRLLAVEAESRGIEVEELVRQEIADKVAAISDEQVDSFYEAEKNRIGRPKEQVADQIRQYLAGQETQSAQQKLISTLREKYEVRSYLEPMRAAVETEGSPSRGPADAAVTIVEFSDFQCPFCSRVVPTLDRILEEYGDKVRLVFRQFPLHSIHPQAQKAAEASLCAADQGKFWEMHDAMFGDQSGLAVEKLKEKAAALELDGEAFAECLDSDRHAERVNRDLQAGMALGVSGTPAMFVNGRFLSGAQPFDEIAAVIEDELRRQGS